MKLVLWGEWRLTTCMILWRKFTTNAAFVTVHFVFYFLQRYKEECPAIWALRTQNQKTDEVNWTFLLFLTMKTMAICFWGGGGDDGLWWTPPIALVSSPGLFKKDFPMDPERQPASPSARPEPAERRTSKSSPPKCVVSVYISVWMIDHRYCTPRDCRERLPFLGEPHCFFKWPYWIPSLKKKQTKKRDTCRGDNGSGEMFVFVYRRRHLQGTVFFPSLRTLGICRLVLFFAGGV